MTGILDFVYGALLSLAMLAAAVCGLFIIGGAGFFFAIGGDWRIVGWVYLGIEAFLVLGLAAWAADD